MDLAYQLCEIKNLVVVSNEKTKNFFLQEIYPYNIDCIVLTKKEAIEYEDKNYKIVFIGCYIDTFKHCENIIIDNFLKLNFQLNKESKFNINWTPQNLAMFINLWFSQTKLKKMNNNLTKYYDNKKTNSWIKGLMV